MIFPKALSKLGATKPSYAFGTDLFPQNVLNAVLEDLPDTNVCKTNVLSECLVLLERRNASRLAGFSRHVRTGVAA